MRPSAPVRTVLKYDEKREEYIFKLLTNVWDTELEEPIDSVSVEDIAGLPNKAQRALDELSEDETEDFFKGKISIPLTVLAKELDLHTERYEARTAAHRSFPDLRERLQESIQTSRRISDWLGNILQYMSSYEEALHEVTSPQTEHQIDCMQQDLEYALQEVYISLNTSLKNLEELQDTVDYQKELLGQLGEG